MPTSLYQWFSGQLKPGKHNMRKLLAFNSKELEKQEKNKPVAANSVQVAIFVHAITDPIPENLMSALRKALRPESETEKSKNVTLLGILLHHDTMTSDNFKCFH